VNMKYLHATDLARAVGVHPNTVQRGANGYRCFTQQHLDCLRVAHIVHSAIYPGRAFRLSGGPIVQCAVADDWVGALEHARAHLAFVQAERGQAEAAALLLERWAIGATPDATEPPMRIKLAAQLLDISIDVLRNWEHNGFITTPRDANNGYRLYGRSEISRLRVIRVLSRVGFSQMAILRMLLQLGRGDTTGLRAALDTPAPGEDIYSAADRWLSTLAEQEQVARRLLAVIEEIISNRMASKFSP
jgi:DNA-binding transcriptional MerR regulator